VGVLSPRGWSDDAGRAVLATLPSDERLVLPALQALQGAFGFVPPESLRLVARTLNVSVADVHGVLTFYSDLRTDPPAPVTVSVCTAEACQAVGSRALADDVARALAPLGSRSPDGRVDVHEVFCLGNCALGPAAMVDGHLVGRATVEAVLAGVQAAGEGS
jgi:formate dehydrogenase subunit gamma